MDRAERVSHRRATNAFIRADSTNITINRPVFDTNARAGKTLIDTLVLPAQRVHLTRHTSSGADDAESESGETSWFKTLLVGMWNLDIEKYDLFQAGGIDYVVDFVETDREYQTRARISARMSG